nr:bifunctional peptidase and (3S)-lysyl hydroxylase Jmjd7-like [Procambarus clarkii]XP_045581538.1 bifunctional peptidase and (3S)-lysyl hydroxylase Jmjd7-like [Procambarus clarkii]XP_045581539.1 bifunctional peptidase and (3S)-lysyl hydroxylase Jmjd7-like [Procambarus clarkii]XP_045581540.1 bifunctional peptidase and (3S)-lysyl hydroxylase Jmjd7-like [Procambarus clarkii]XP_045581541.1 bifunctional peptidase and (3S)-lysyl hydroxylase Jmjd7-like [Procambarus clarkii]
MSEQQNKSTTASEVDSDVLNPEPRGKIEECFLKLSLAENDYHLSKQVPILDDVPTPLDLYRDWVAPNRPVIFRGAVREWPAIKKWSFKYLREKVGNKEVSVAVTPNGYADAPCSGYFVMPEERSMKFGNFLNIMENPSIQPGVFYVQKQNSNFTMEFPEIICDAAPDIPWFTEALGRNPDAVNFWMGDQRAVSSMHKDHYENIYCVISGYKDFILLPPTDLPWIPYKSYPAASYKEVTAGNFDIQENTNTGSVPWICIDPLKPDLKKYPQYRLASPVHCRVQAGDALYLPSLWYHHVRQSHACIAVNYWYDMEFDIKYNYYKLVQNLSWVTEPE